MRAACVQRALCDWNILWQSKPTDLDFIDDFVNEYKHLRESGVSFRGQIFITCISAFICDAPARAFLKKIKSHTAYSSCERCTQTGEWKGKMTFPEINAP